ncbi:MAG: DpnII family type II restriction endonuclease [Candidatus Methylomirabilales bacterium]
MADLEIYKGLVGTPSLDSIVELFLKTIADTNRTYSFFVDWNKVRKRVESLRFELGILGAVGGAGDPKAELRKALSRYPECAKAIPLLLAVREEPVKVVEVFEQEIAFKSLFFHKNQFTDDEREAIVCFCERTGLLAALAEVRTIRDYFFGVEVGTDTNARKNRSGTAMEDLLRPAINRVAEQLGFAVYEQKTFNWLSGQTGVRVPKGLANRKFDITLAKGGQLLSMELNFYAGTGSKPQEIVDSYIQRKREFADAGWGFIWITDGDGWRRGANQVRKAFEHIDYVLNLHFVRKGLLEKAVARAAARVK